MRRLFGVTLGLLLGYAAGAAAGMLFVHASSGNRHDRAQEMVMTAAFFTGPIGAIAGLATGLLWRRQ